jgi:hypothetical protein
MARTHEEKVKLLHTLVTGGGSLALRHGWSAGVSNSDRVSPYDIRTAERYEWFAGWDAGNCARAGIAELVMLALKHDADDPMVLAIVNRCDP